MLIQKETLVTMDRPEGPTPFGRSAMETASFSPPESRPTSDTLESLWGGVLERLKSQFKEEIYNLWVKPLHPLRWEDPVLTVQVPNQYFTEWIKKNALGAIKSAFQDILGRDLDIRFETAEFKPVEEEMPRPMETPALPTVVVPSASAVKQEDQFNAKYTFDTFVVGPSNRFVQAAAAAVAKDPGKTYNPLFLYGGVGLGKTHILHAIGHGILQHRPGARVLYVSSERFINEFIEAIRFDKMNDFRMKYRSLDCLLIDDIQSLMSKDSSQEEFFYTFNSLYDGKKQIIISSDRPPTETKVSARLISRFEWGIVADMQPPDLETRIAILRKKAAMENMYVPEDVILYIAHHIRSNIRELEGSLIRTVAFSSLTGTPLSIESARETLKDIVSSSIDNQPVHIDDIQEVVAEHFNLDVKDMKSKRRTDAIAFPRQIAMYLARTMTEASTTEIGDHFGGKDHTTVMHATNKIRAKMTSDPYFTALVNKITQQIKTHAAL